MADYFLLFKENSIGCLTAFYWVRGHSVFFYKLKTMS